MSDKTKRLPIVSVGGVKVLVDTGSTSTIMSKRAFKEISALDNPKIQVCACNLITLNGSSRPLGEGEINLTRLTGLDRKQLPETTTSYLGVTFYEPQALGSGVNQATGEYE